MRIKRCIRNQAERVLAKRIKDISIGKEIKIVSFDIFDTLIVRNVSIPETVFELVKNRYNEEHSECKLPDHFSKLRIAAERNTRKKAGIREITLEEIYSNLDEINDCQKKEVSRIEIELECAICQPNYEMQFFFKKLVEKDIPIIIISDMYLSREIIGRILKKCGYSGYKKLYVSSEIGDTKASGILFEKVMDDMQIRGEELLHIGDNIRGDYWNPKRKGIKTFLYRRERYTPC